MTKRLHFVDDFDLDDESHDTKVYTCKRCGEQVIGETACTLHRHGLISDCLINRIKNWLDEA